MMTDSVSSTYYTGMIDSATGELTVTEVATSDYGGQKYQCTCGTESSCHIIHCKLGTNNYHSYYTLPHILLVQKHIVLGLSLEVGLYTATVTGELAMTTTYTYTVYIYKYFNVYL